ncbi:MAG: hypothetical protein RL564_2161, partial [Pseudomonadota bacterium]
MDTLLPRYRAPQLVISREVKQAANKNAALRTGGVFEFSKARRLVDRADLVHCQATATYVINDVDVMLNDWLVELQLGHAAVDGFGRLGIHFGQYLKVSHRQLAVAA